VRIRREKKKAGKYRRGCRTKGGWDPDINSLCNRQVLEEDVSSERARGSEEGITPESIHSPPTPIHVKIATSEDEGNVNNAHLEVRLAEMSTQTILAISLARGMGREIASSILTCRAMEG
jgi:hypothetical protein